MPYSCGLQWTRVYFKRFHTECFVRCLRQFASFLFSLPARNPTSFLSLAGAATSIIFVETKVSFLSRQKYACRDKTFGVFGATKVLSRQSIFSRQIYFFRGKSFVAASIHLLRQKTYFVATNTSSILLSRQKTILVAAPANDIFLLFSFFLS